MSKQKNILLFVILALQTALLVFLYRPGQETTAPQLQLFAELQPGQVSSLTITDDEGKSITLDKAAAWKVGAEGYPGDPESIDAFLNKIAALRSSRLVTTTRGSHGRLKVSDSLFNKKVTIRQQDKELTLLIGTSPNSKSVHLRRSGDNEVHQVSGLAAWEVQTEPSSWWQDQYVAIDGDQLRGVHLTNAHGSLTISKNEEGKWLLEGAEPLALDQAKLDDFLAAIKSIPVAAYLPATHTESGPPAATITYTLNEGPPVTLRIWPGQEENEDQVAKLSTSDFHAKIRAYALKEIVDAKADGLLTAADQPPPEN